ncbi:hypothetical protein [Thiocapsa roseopersicina]|uniref:Uncharacterized protein n=1 Tax=Thiocapsa roseopersicina TaxID=1058 RepID=A0A1H3DEL8_THIRO|nr:hypothetical protein [Thiocapsa roseopersicina]SDX64134.1 hypothetical protein SAMN05421783_14618 [Thiocapsa roseopersicina]
MRAQDRFRAEFPDLDPGEIRPVNGTLVDALAVNPHADVFMLPEDPSGFVVKRDDGTVFVSIGKDQDRDQEAQAHPLGPFERRD